MPKAKGGKNNRRNLAVAHEKCNIRRGARLTLKPYFSSFPKQWRGAPNG